jgi:nucleotide-binding universal stress UspA family protein
MKILVPVDFSSASENALEYGMSLLKGKNIELFFLHAFYLSPASPDVIELRERQELEEVSKLYEKKLCDFASKINARTGLACKTIIRYGAVSNVVKEAVETLKPDLIIMGTTGASGVAKFFVGSNTVEVLEQSNIPVLAIPEGFGFKPLEKILFATDFVDSDINSVVQLSAIASAFDAEVVVMHVSSDDKNSPEMLDWFESKVKEKTTYSKIRYRLNRNQDVLEVIGDFIKNYGIDLLALSKRERNFFDKLFSKSISSEMAYKAQIPMLVFRAEEDNDIFNIF